MSTLVTHKPVSKWLVALIAFGMVGVLAAIGFSIALYQVQQQRIDNLHSIITSTKTSDASNYTSLLDRYSGLYKELTDKGVTPTAPAPSTLKLVPGPAGQNASSSQVMAAVTIYCDLRLDCQGPPGNDSVVPGPKGDTGDASTVPGPPGPAGSNGTNGADGKDGKDAPTITGVDCSGLIGQTFTFELSDGSSYTATCN